MFVVDTNLLLYAVNRDFAEHEQARELLEEWRSGDADWFLTWPIIYEFMRVSTHAAVFPAPLDLRAARAWIDILLSGGRAGVLVHTDRHRAVLNELASEYPRLRGNIMHDFHTAAMMREHGITEIRTADADFHQFKFVRVVNPLA